MGARVRIINGKVIADPFPKSNDPNLAVVTSTPIKFGGSLKPRASPRIRSPSPESRFDTPDLPNFAIDDKIEKGSSFFPSQSPNRSLGSISIGDPRIGRKKRSKLSKKDKAKKKKKAKPKPLKSIFDLSF